MFLPLQLHHRLEQMKKSLEQQRRDLEDKRRQFEKDKQIFDDNQRLRLETSKWVTKTLNIFAQNFKKYPVEHIKPGSYFLQMQMRCKFWPHKFAEIIWNRWTVINSCETFNLKTAPWRQKKAGFSFGHRNWVVWRKRATLSLLLIYSVVHNKPVRSITQPLIIFVLFFFSPIFFLPHRTLDSKKSKTKKTIFWDSCVLLISVHTEWTAMKEGPQHITSMCI